MAHPQSESWLSTFRQPDIPAAGRLALRIGEVSLRNAEALKGLIHAEDEKEHQRRWFTVVCEFLYLFMHLTNRFAYGFLGHEKRCKMQDQIYPIIVRPMIQTIFRHWPSNLKEGMEGDFADKLNDAEIEYGQCKQMFDPKMPFCQDALFAKFATVVCDLLGVEKTDGSEYTGTYLKVVELAVSSFREIRLADEVRAIGKEL